LRGLTLARDDRASPFAMARFRLTNSAGIGALLKMTLPLERAEGNAKEGETQWLIQELRERWPS
jgi:hypothetical protein